jgi:hypothetical protein
MSLVLSCTKLIFFVFITNQRWPPPQDVFNQRWKFSSDQLISSFFSKIFGNKMFQTWCNQLKNEVIWALYRGFLFFHQRTLSSLFNIRPYCKMCTSIKKNLNLIEPKLYVNNHGLVFYKVCMATIAGQACFKDHLSNAWTMSEETGLLYYSFYGYVHSLHLFVLFGYLM